MLSHDGAASELAVSMCAVFAAYLDCVCLCLLKFLRNYRSLLKSMWHLVKEIYGSALPFPLPQAIKRLGELAELGRLAEGKITVDEAERLFTAVASSENNISKDNGMDKQERLHKFSQSVESLAKGCGEKICKLAKDAEPTLKKATRTVMEKTARIMNDISKSLNESLENLETKGGECVEVDIVAVENKDLPVENKA